MPVIRFIDCDGEERIIDSAAGQSIMEIARGANIPGIVARCGGALACATCHVYVADQSSFPEKNEWEEELLDGVFDELTDQSRLSCQLYVTAESDGVEIRTPSVQG